MTNKEKIAEILDMLHKQSKKLSKIEQLVCPHKDVDFMRSDGFYVTYDGHISRNYWKKCINCGKILQIWKHEDKQEWLKAQIEEPGDEK